MSRPLYENDETLWREYEAAQEVEKWSGATLKKIPIRYGLDYGIVREGEIVAFAELKCRTNRKDDFDSYMISLGKIQSARSLAETTGLDTFLFVFWKDASGWLDFKTVPFWLQFGGRVDRNDPQDIEPMCHIPMSSFKELR